MATKRLHASVLTLPDTGLKIEEAISLHQGDVDLDNPLLKVREKGRKERRVPFSMECRRHLYKWLQTQRWVRFCFPPGVAARC